MLAAMRHGSFAITTAWIKTEPVILVVMAALLLGDPITLPAFAAILAATFGVFLVTVRPGAGLAAWGDTRPLLMGLGAASLFGLAAIGFRGAIVALPEGSSVIRASTVLCMALAFQSGLLGLYLWRTRPGLLGETWAEWRASVGAGMLGALASQFWFIAFALTTAANVRTLALVEVIFAQAVARLPSASASPGVNGRASRSLPPVWQPCSGSRVERPDHCARSAPSIRSSAS